MKQTLPQKLKSEFFDKFVETYGDGSDWGVGVRIKSDGTTNDRETLDNIIEFFAQALADQREQIAKEIEEMDYDVENMTHGIEDLWNLVEQSKIVAKIRKHELLGVGE